MAQRSVRSFFSPNQDVNQNVPFVRSGSHQEGSGMGSSSGSVQDVTVSVGRKRKNPEPSEDETVTKKAPDWLNTCEVMSLKDICDNADKWVVLDVQSTLASHKSTSYDHKAGIPADFSKCWPYIEQIKVSDILVNSPQHFEEGKLFEDFIDESENEEKRVKQGCDRVVGLLCKVCRQNYTQAEIGSLFNKNGLVFINKPRSAPFGSVREILKLHEFGKKVKGEVWKAGPTKLREKFLSSSSDVKDLGSTNHMRFQLDLKSQQIVKEKRSRPDELLTRKVCSNMGNSKDAITVLFANVLKLIKSRTSVFTNLKPELQFQRQFGASDPVKFLVDTLKMHYTSVGSINEIIDSLDYARHFGVLQDVMAQRPEGQDPSFGALLDCGSGQAHFREFVGFDIKVEDCEGSMVCRILGFPSTDRKTGYHLIRKFGGLVDEFNRCSNL